MLPPPLCGKDCRTVVGVADVKHLINTSLSWTNLGSSRIRTVASRQVILYRFEKSKTSEHFKNLLGHD